MKDVVKYSEENLRNPVVLSAAEIEMIKTVWYNPNVKLYLEQFGGKIMLDQTISLYYLLI